MNKVVLVPLLVALIGGGCSSGTPDQLAIVDQAQEAPTSTSEPNSSDEVLASPTTTAAPDEQLATWVSPLDSFCADMQSFQSGQVTDPDTLFALYDDIVAGAPAEIEAETMEFVAAGRKISETVAAYMAEVEVVDPEELFARLEPDSIEYLETLDAAAKTGELPPGSIGVVTKWYVQHCDGLESAWSSRFDVASIEVRLVDDAGFASTKWPVGPSIEQRIQREEKSVPRTTDDAAVQLCIDGNSFEPLAAEFGDNRSMLFDSDGKVWEVTVVPDDPFSNFRLVSCTL